MISTIRKRDGKLVPYDNYKIANAIFKAVEAVKGHDKSLPFQLAKRVEEVIGQKFHSNSIPAVEEIQDIVERVLIENGYVDIVKAYILYREQRRRVRTTNDLLLDIANTMDGYLRQEDWRVNENSNVNYSLGGLILHNSGAITANYWLENIYGSDISSAHRNGDIHLHDLCMFSGYCAGWSLRQLIAEGLGGVKGKISSKPPKHLSTLIQQMVNFLGIMQNEWAGAQAFSSFDTYLAPFVRVDNLSFAAVKQQIQSFVFGVNTPSRWGSQAPFTNITLDWTVPDDLKDQPAVVGGVPLEQTYGDFQKEMDIVNRAFLEVLIEGDSDGRGFSYPIPTYNITPNFNWDSENAQLLFKMTGKYGTPYFQNFINSTLNPGDVRSMCCRLQLDKRELRNRGGGLFGADEFTGSIGVVTINLPRIGFLSKSEADYYKQLDHYMDIARDSLEIKRKVITKLMEQGLFPYTQRYLRHWNNHFSTIGLIGMNESTLNFMGKDLTDPQARQFAMEVLNHMRSRLIMYQEETGHLYNLEATPGEGTSYRLAKIDRSKFSGMIIPGGDAPYFTNSTQLPVNATPDLFGALDMQNDIQRQYTGGTVFHAHIGESIDDVEVCKKLVRYIAYNYQIPYFTLSPTFSICPLHGYLKGEHFSCPTCSEETEVYARIVGYYRPVQNWNPGKKSEFGEREEFSYKLDADEPATNAPAREPITNRMPAVQELNAVEEPEAIAV
ncbi:MAG: ribonucleoside triphosphate reductase [Chitinispirillia bacterium]|nr:ribonucleoside triphosphate reductase [Chitinispirillia bacterium]MCL2268755.1 ribonucleoside triphosphate reductase [Chitinispirillia bacterium]